jgi:Flp pilus assembly protein protease CpaA
LFFSSFFRVLLRLSRFQSFGLSKIMNAILCNPPMTVPMTAPSVTPDPQPTYYRWALMAPLAAAPVWITLARTINNPIDTVSELVLVLAVAVSAFTDGSSRKIYNWITYPAILWGLGLNLLGSIRPDFNETLSLGAVGLPGSLLGFLACGMITLFGYRMSGGGAGDVKLAAAIGALLGLQAGVLAVAYSYIFAAIAILAWTAYKFGPLKLLSAGVRKVLSIFMPNMIFAPSEAESKLLLTPIPLGPYFALGTLLVMVKGLSL